MLNINTDSCGEIKLKIYDFGGKKNISGERIREARQRQRLSQSDLAARLQSNRPAGKRKTIFLPILLQNIPISQQNLHNQVKVWYKLY